MTCVGSVDGSVRRTRRWTAGGFTLLEVILTLGLLVILAAVFWPNIAAMSEASRLERGVDDVRALLVGLRVRAMDDATRYQFSCQPGTGSFWVTRLGEADTTLEDQGAIETSARALFDAEDLAGAHELEKGLTFAVDPAVQERSGDDSGVVVISFNSDGTTSDAVFDLVDDAGIGTTIQVRGMTGAVTVRPRGLAAR